MTSDFEQLDRMIDALNDRRDPEREGFVDTDMAELIDLARGLKSLGHTRWPDETFPTRAASKLSSKLTDASNDWSESIQFDDDESDEIAQRPPLPRLDQDRLPIPLSSRRSRTRKSLEIAAAVAVLALFGGLVSMLLRGPGSGTVSPTAQAGQGPNAAATSPFAEFSSTITAVNDAGNGRYLRLVKSDGGLSVTVEWAGSTFDRVMLLISFDGNGQAFGIASASDSSVRATLGTAGVIDPYKMTMRTSNGTSLPEIGAVCGQSACLVKFDRMPIDGRSGDIRLHAEITGLMSRTNDRTEATPQALTALDATANFAFDFSLPAWSNGAATASTQPSSTPTTSPSPASAPTVSDPALVALQQAAGFALYAPKTSPDGLTLQQPQPPLSLPGFTSTIMKYADASGSEVLTITEASPYQDSAQTMPTDVWNNATPVEMQSDAFGRVTAYLYQSGSDIQLWWEVGKSSIRLESGGAPGTTMLTKDQIMNVALSMLPVATADAQTPATPTSGTGITRDQAVAKARAVISNLGGNTQAEATSVALQPLLTQTALGLPQPNGTDPNAPVWVIAFDDALSPAGCPGAGASVCSHGQLTVVLEATAGRVLGFHKDDGKWQ